MTRPNLETELLNTWNAEVAKLTDAERKQLAAATPADWFAAIASCLRDPQFWQGIGVALLEGVAQGVEDYLNDTDR
jgi:hypothetical protein